MTDKCVASSIRYNNKFNQELMTHFEVGEGAPSCTYIRYVFNDYFFKWLSTYAGSVMRA